MRRGIDSVYSGSRRLNTIRIWRVVCGVCGPLWLIHSCVVRFVRPRTVQRDYGHSGGVVAGVVWRGMGEALLVHGLTRATCLIVTLYASVWRGSVIT